LRVILNFTGAAVILCVCQSVTDREVEAAIREGARSLSDVSDACGAGSDCGGCRRAIEQRLDGPFGGSCADCPRREHELASAAL
jgi:bacterioferritin-associated ferredoxin